MTRWNSEARYVTGWILILVLGNGLAVSQLVVVDGYATQAACVSAGQTGAASWAPRQARWRCFQS